MHDWWESKETFSVECVDIFEQTIRKMIELYLTVLDREPTTAEVRGTLDLALAEKFDLE